jgi:hypothetical protein
MSWFKLKEPMGTNYRVDPGDGRTCNGVTARLGKEAGACCWRSASERYAACIAGRPQPPLSGGW